MSNEILNVIHRLQSDERLTSLGEARVRSAIVDPILRALGWNTDNPDEVWPEWGEGREEVDYALFTGSTVRVLVEAKKGGESLAKQAHQDQLLSYSFKHGVKIAILTNGTVWWFYLPLQEGSWEQRKFYAVEFDKQDGAEIAQKFVTLLSKANVSSGKAVQTAEDLYKRHQIAETLPMAWDQLVEDTIANLLTIRTEELCGHEPDKNEVNQFLSKMRFPQITPPTERVSPPEPNVEHEPTPQPNPSGQSQRTTCRAFTFCGNRYEVSSWRGMIVKLCEIVHEAHRDRFEEVLNLGAYFSRHPKGQNPWKEINATGIYVELHGGRENEKRGKKLITHFGYSANDLSCEIHTY